MAGLRFDKVDPRLYMELGKTVGEGYVRHQAADAGTAAQQEQTRYEPGTAEAQDPEQMGPAYQGNQQYGLGKAPSAYQDTPFTPEQKRAAGLQGQMDYYISKGNTEQADKIRLQLYADTKNKQDTEAHGLAMKRGAQQVAMGDSEVARTQESDAAHEDAKAAIAKTVPFLFGSAISGPTPSAPTGGLAGSTVNPVTSAGSAPDSQTTSASVAAAFKAAPGEHATTGAAQQLEGERQALALRYKEAFANRDTKAQAGIVAEASALQQKAIGVQAAAKWQQMTPQDQQSFAAHVTQGYSGDVAMTVPDKNGYTHVSIGKPGTADYKSVTLTPAETFKFFHATELMNSGFVDQAQALMDAGGKNLRDIQDTHNKFVLETSKAGNTGITEQRTSNAALTTAGAAATNAQTNKDYKNKQIEVIDNAESRRQEVDGLKIKLNNLSVDDPQYASKRRDLLTQIDVANLKPGGQVNLRDPSDGSGRGGAKGAPPPIEWTKDGTVAVHRDTKNPLFHMGDNGTQLPLGMSQQQYDKNRKEAADLGVKVVTDFDGNQDFRMAFFGPDGQAYDNAREAAASKAPAKDKPAAAAEKPKATGLKPPSSGAKGRGGVAISNPLGTPSYSANMQPFNPD